MKRRAYRIAAVHGLELWMALVSTMIIAAALGSM